MSENENEQPWIMETQGGRTVTVSRKPKGALMRVDSAYQGMDLSLDAEELIALRDRLSEILGDGNRPNDRRVFLADACLWLKNLVTTNDEDAAMRNRLQSFVHDLHVAASTADQSALRAEEVAYLLESERCETCPHRKPLHDDETGECDIPGCDCGLRRWQAEHKGHSVIDTLRSADKVAMRCQDCRASYEIGSGS